MVVHTIPLYCFSFFSSPPPPSVSFFSFSPVSRSLPLSIFHSHSLNSSLSFTHHRRPSFLRHTSPAAVALPLGSAPYYATVLPSLSTAVLFFLRHCAVSAADLLAFLPPSRLLLCVAFHRPNFIFLLWLGVALLPPTQTLG